ncbi:MAG: TldD/PmbA family protein [Clostridia bacterium]|nr:TldD/PmbA family protein [Clostridia bacterium]
MLKESIIQNALSIAQKTGADFAELFLEDTTTNGISMTDGKVESATCARKNGVGIRVLKGTSSAYAYTSGTDEADIYRAAEAAAAGIVGVGEGKSAVFSRRSYAMEQRIPFKTVANDERIELLRAGTAACREVSNEITQVSASYMDKVRRVLICNSEGTYVIDERPRTRSFVQAIAMKDGEAQTGRESPGCCGGFEVYRDRIDIVSAGRAAGKTAVTMLSGKECPAGNVPVVIDGGFGGVIFHEACGHSLEATSVSLGNSEFCGKLGQQIAAPCVSACDNGTLEGEWGTILVDDEGTEGRNNLLIENGVLKGYMIDLLGSRRMGMPVTGNSRRQDYTYAPTSRMTNTYIMEGTDDEEEMIRTMGTGLYAAKLGGGSVNPLTGEFNFAVLEGYWVKDGKIYCPVRGAMLIDTGSQILKRIDRVGPRMWMGQGMCGSLSGSVPTNVGQPRIRVTELTVGGKGGAL